MYEVRNFHERCNVDNFLSQATERMHKVGYTVDRNSMCKRIGTDGYSVCSMESFGDGQPKAIFYTENGWACFEYATEYAKK